MGRPGRPGVFTVEVMSDLKSEGDTGNLQAQGSTNTEALRWAYARNSEEIGGGAGGGAGDKGRDGGGGAVKG